MPTKIVAGECDAGVGTALVKVYGEGKHVTRDHQGLRPIFCRLTAEAVRYKANSNLKTQILRSKNEPWGTRPGALDFQPDCFVFTGKFLFDSLHYYKQKKYFDQHYWKPKQDTESFYAVKNMFDKYP